MGKAVPDMFGLGAEKAEWCLWSVHGDFAYRRDSNKLSLGFF